MPTRNPGDAQSGQLIAGLVSVGQQLASARNEQKISVQSIASELKLSSAVVKALEEGNEAGLPAQTYLRGYIRAYAKRLGLDGTLLIAELPGIDTIRIPLPHGSQKPKQLRLPLPSLKLVSRLVLIGLLVVAVIYGIPFLERWWSSSDDFMDASPDSGVDVLVLPDVAESIPIEAVELEQPQLQPQPQDLLPGAESKTDVVEAMTVETKPVEVLEVVEKVRAVAVESVLLLRFAEDSWVEVQAQDEKLINSVQTAGTERTIRATPPFSVLLGNAPAVEVLYNGVPVNTAPYSRGNVARLVLGERDVE